MSDFLLQVWNAVARLGLARPSATEWTLLILLAALVLVLRAFRDNYFKLWVLGWAAVPIPTCPRWQCPVAMCMRVVGSQPPVPARPITSPSGMGAVGRHWV